MAKQMTASAEDRWDAREAELTEQFDLELQSFELQVERAIIAISKLDVAIRADERELDKAQTTYGGQRGHGSRLRLMEQKLQSQRKKRNREAQRALELLSSQKDTLISRYESAWSELLQEAERDEVVTVAAERALENLKLHRNRLLRPGVTVSQRLRLKKSSENLKKITPRVP